MVILSFVGMVLLALSIPALVWVSGITEIWTTVPKTDNCEQFDNCCDGYDMCRCVGDTCSSMNENATTWHKFCFGGGTAGIVLGALCIFFGVVWGCLSNRELKRRQTFGNMEGTT